MRRYAPSGLAPGEGGAVQLVFWALHHGIAREQPAEVLDLSQRKAEHVYHEIHGEFTKCLVKR